MLEKSDINKEFKMRIASKGISQDILEEMEERLLAGVIDNKKFGISFLDFFREETGEICVSIYTSFSDYSRLRSTILKGSKSFIFRKVYITDPYPENDITFTEELDFSKINKVQEFKDLFGIRIEILFSKEDSEKIIRLIFDDLLDPDTYYNNIYVEVYLEYKENKEREEAIRNVKENV